MTKKVMHLIHNGEKIPFIITKPKGTAYEKYPEAIWVECKKAWFAEIWDETDLDVLVKEVLPEYIDEKIRESKKVRMYLRVSNDEKIKIKRLAKSRGFESVSEYMRDRALAEN